MLNALEHVDDRPHIYVEPGLLAHLAPHCVGKRFSQLNPPARNRPLPLVWVIRTLDDNRFIASDNHRAHADNGSIGKFVSHLPHLLHRRSVTAADALLSHSPMTLTTTRFFRCPSNSA